MNAEKRVIKKYPNRRLYDTATSSYITLADVKQMVLDNVDIQVVDAKSQEDLTRSVLLQIILEEESGGVPMFSHEVLTQLIRFYGQAMQGVMGPFLERNMRMFAQFQNTVQQQTRSMVGEGGNTLNNIWSDLLRAESSAVQHMVQDYMEQSTHLMRDVQSTMQEQTLQMFGHFGFPPRDTAKKD